MEFMSDLGSNADIYRPSLFELIAQEKMHELLQPAIRYILSVYAQRYPRYLLRIVNRLDEVYAIILLFIERHYLKEWGASFTENFYGLKRIRSLRTTMNLGESSSKELEKLRDRDIWRSLLALIGISYIKTKLDDYYESVSGGAGVRYLGSSRTSLREDVNYHRLTLAEKTRYILRNFFSDIYPWINSFYNISILAYNIAYLYEKTRYYTPWLHFLGIEIRRMSVQDYREYTQRKIISENIPRVPTTRFQAGANFLYTILSRGFDFLKILLPMSIFFYKFLEWWYSSEFTRKPGGDSEIEVPPPEKLLPDPRGLPVPNIPNTCPICSNPLNNPTALPSGYVFCYKCVYNYVENYNRCPVTWIRVDIDRLRKVYNAIS
ncbi:3203_t:CDS:2 [Ambispora gerdemannii]|uniref:Peroxisome assembly protein 12 n=1 Tax=Ambispora gerdemannii TaxID=144530 RepID=A0A9N8YPT3_9GLOM|nr:3203_t:CDS:2 [Ambispora gerdemannii]